MNEDSQETLTELICIIRDAAITLLPHPHPTVVVNLTSFSNRAKHQNDSIQTQTESKGTSWLGPDVQTKLHVMMVRVTRFSNVLTQAANDRQTTATDSATADLNDVSQCYSWPRWCVSATADLCDVSALQLTSMMCQCYSWPQWCVSATADLSDVSQ